MTLNIARKVTDLIAFTSLTQLNQAISSCISLFILSTSLFINLKGHSEQGGCPFRRGISDEQCKSDGDDQ